MGNLFSIRPKRQIVRNIDSKVESTKNNGLYSTENNHRIENNDYSRDNNYKIKNIDYSTENNQRIENNEASISHILKIVTRIYENFLREDNDCDTKLLSRTTKKRPICKNTDVNSDDEILSKYPRRDCPSVGMKLFTNFYSYEELVNYLNDCSKESDNSSGKLEVAQLVSSFRELIVECEEENNEEIQLEKLKTLLIVQKKHLVLAEDKNLFEDFKLILNLAATKGIISKVIDLKDDYKNSAISLAIINANIAGFCYLIKRKAKIPRHIYENGKKIPFLHYIALHGLIKMKKTTEYLLIPVLKVLIEYYDNEKVEKYLSEIDSESMMSLPHLLLSIFQSSTDIRDKLTECLTLCLNNCPQSFQIMCPSYYCFNYKFDVISHAIILPVTNFEIIKHFMKSYDNGHNKGLYQNLLAVHEDQKKRKKLLEIIINND